MELLIDTEFRSLIPPLAPEEYAELERSLINEGNRSPIDTWQGYIVDGHNRYDICQKNNIPLKPANELKLANREDVKIWIINNQLARRNLSPAARIQLNIKKHDIQLQKDARERQGERTDLHPSNFPQIFGESEKHNREVDALIGDATGVSRETVRKFRHIETIATPEQKEKLRKGEATINQVFVTLKREEIKQNIKTTEWPAGKYRVIYADPPWQYDDKAPGYHGAVENHYTTMSIEELCKLPLTTCDDAVLFIWVTSPFLEDVFKIINSWGFKYKASFIWDKVNHNMGHFNSVRHEFLLIATKGKCQPDANQLFDSVQSIQSNGHSKKPAEFRNIIQTLYPYGPRVELFAREKVGGWDYHGNEVINE